MAGRSGSFCVEGAICYLDGAIFYIAARLVLVSRA
jgi:hypothetical protein